MRLFERLGYFLTSLVVIVQGVSCDAKIQALHYTVLAGYVLTLLLICIGIKYELIRLAQLPNSLGVLFMLIMKAVNVFVE